MKLITLCEDKALEGSNLKSIHGLSLYIEVKNHIYLYDTGQENVFLENAKTLGVDLTKCEKVIISHGHYDHGGGLNEIKDSLNKDTLIINKKAFKERARVKEDNSIKDIGISNIAGDLEYLGLSMEKSFKLDDGIWCICNVNMPEGYESTDRRLCAKDKDGNYKTDNFDDEISLAIETNEGLVVVSGCSHVGVINILNEAKRITGINEINTFIGGMHLVKSSKETIINVAEEIKALNVKRLLIGHCTGEDAVNILKDKLKNKADVVSIYAGYEFEDKILI